jgi:hypothetical protein
MSLLPTIGAIDQDTGFYNGVATQSLRFDDGSVHKLTRTFTGDYTNAKKMTISVWAKRGNISNATQVILSAYNSVRYVGELSWRSDDKISFDPGGNGDGSQNSYAVQTTALFRDVSAWYHIVLAYDTTQSTDTNRVKLYVNGTQQTLEALDGNQTFPPEDYLHTYSYNGANNEIGNYTSVASAPLDGYLAEFNFVDGLALAPTSFGETKNGTWIAIKYTGSYGNKGYRLEFKGTGTSTSSGAVSSPTNIGDDSSGLNNHWAVSGNATYDSNMPDSPENNFATLNPLFKTYNNQPTFSEGNLKAAVSQVTYQNTFSSIGVSSGKWYVEMKQNGTTNSANFIGVATDLHLSALQQVSTYIGSSGNGIGYSFYMHSSRKYSNGDQGAYGSRTTDGQIIGVALDLDNKKIYFSIDGTYINSGDPVNGTNFAFENLIDSHYFFGTTLYQNGYSSAVWNFGQDSSFLGSETATSNSDANGNGTFHTAPPSGFLALCTANFEDDNYSTIGPNSATTSTDHFGTLTYSSDGNAVSIVSGGNDNNGNAIGGEINFKPDWVWMKGRSEATANALQDSSRGVTKYLITDSSNGEGTLSDLITSFDSNGFSLGTNVNINNNTKTYVAWNWKANGGTTSSNSNGTITSTVQADNTSGFSIVTWSGNETNGATIGHGLSSAPQIILTKCRSHATSWIYGIGQITGSVNDYLTLNTTSDKGNSTTFYQSYTSDSNTTFTVGVSSADEMNRNTGGTARTYVSYCFAEVEGFSKFDQYYSNNSTDGTFVYTGFRPAWIMIKAYSGVGDGSWIIYDAVRDPDNVTVNYLLGNSAATEDTNTGIQIDMLSNGFKPRGNNSNINAGSDALIYMAFAEAPFKYANAR